MKPIMGSQIIVVDESGKRVFGPASELVCEAWIVGELGTTDLDLPQFMVARRHPKAFASYSNGQDVHFEMVREADLRPH